MMPFVTPMLWTVVWVQLPGGQPFTIDPKPVHNPMMCMVEAQLSAVKFHDQHPDAQILRIGCSRHRETQS